MNPPPTENGAKKDAITVRRDIHQNAAFDGTYGLMNALAAVVACYGLLSDSTAVVIGAMIIATLLGPISAIALALVDGERRLLRVALITEFGGSVMVLGIAMLIGWLHADLPLGKEILLRTRPNLMDLLIALSAGAAGAYATVSPRVSAGLVGVAVATALVPPLAVCGICLARGEFRLGLGGFLLYFANLIAIQVASSLVLWGHGFHKISRPGEKGRGILMRHWLSFTALGVLFIVFTWNFNETVQEQQFERRSRQSLERNLEAYPGVFLRDLRFLRETDRILVTAVLHTPMSFTPKQVTELESHLPGGNGRTVELHIISLITKETTSKGYLHINPELGVEGAGLDDGTQRRNRPETMTP